MAFQYRDLIRVAATVRKDAAAVVEKAARVDALQPLVTELQALLPRLDQVLDQTRRRVLGQEKAPPPRM